MGNLLNTGTAHAQSLSSVTITDCTDESQLQSAVIHASSGETITFGCSGAIPITVTLIISTNLTLDGSGQNVTLDGGNGSQLILLVNNGVTFTLNALTIAHSSDGGLYNNGGTVNVNNSAFASNSSLNGSGLYNNGGTVTINNSAFTNNSASNLGGGLSNYSGTVNISNSTFTGNSTATVAQGGGALFNNSGTVNISNSTFASNSANNGANGGSFYSYGDGSMLNISNSTVANNSGTGGGLFNTNGSTASISNSTIANNNGSGFVNDIGTVSVTNSTIANNSNGGVGSGFVNYDGTVSIGESIIANGTGSNCNDIPGATLDDQGYNLSSDASCGFTASTDQQNTNPMLASALASNGGPTQTLALLDGSPAINKIPASSCPSTDQRGISRPQGPACDIGAFEFRVPILNLPNSPITVNATSDQGATVTYTATGTEPDDASATPIVNCTSTSGSVFPIGSTTVNCTASDAANPPDTTTGSFTVVVKPVLSVSVNNVNATEGAAFSGVVATGTAYGATNPLSATINWGDGSNSTVSVTPNPDGTYSVSGSHTYSEEGSYPLSVTVTDSGSLSATGNGTATVADAALTLTHFAAGPKGKLSAHVAATFTDADPGGQVSDYTATITWGDGSTSTVQVSKKPRGKGFTLIGSHSYASAGTYTVTLTVSDSGGSQLTKTVTLTVK